MKVVLDQEKANQIAEEATILRQCVRNSQAELEKEETLINFERYAKAKAEEESFLRALYIIGVKGVKWVGEPNQEYAFNLSEALEEEGGAK